MIGLNNAIRDYIRTLHNVNSRFLVVASYDAINVSDGDYLLIELISDIVRLIPAKSNDQGKTYVLSKNNGLMTFRNELSDVQKDFSQIINDKQETIKLLFKIRNKYQHSIHSIKVKSIGYSSLEASSIKVEIENKTYDVKSIKIMDLIKQLNIIYTKILEEVLKKYYFNKIPFEYSNYYENLKRFNFVEYNKALNIKTINVVGKFFHPFLG